MGLVAWSTGVEVGSGRSAAGIALAGSLSVASVVGGGSGDFPGVGALPFQVQLPRLFGYGLCGLTIVLQKLFVLLRVRETKCLQRAFFIVSTFPLQD